jgi:hypothetical protein
MYVCMYIKILMLLLIYEQVIIHYIKYSVNVYLKIHIYLYIFIWVYGSIYKWEYTIYPPYVNGNVLIMHSFLFWCFAYQYILEITL